MVFGLWRKFENIFGKKYFYFLIIIFLAGIVIRFLNFHESIYFGYDEARDAYDSQNIYLKGDIKLSGPPASAFKGINHGPFYLYFIGPLFILDSGNPYLASTVFRILNAIGIFIIAYLAVLYFNRHVGLIAAFVYAFSFEQHQYAIFTGNPALSNFFWLLLFLGAGITYKHKSKRVLGLIMMVFSASSITQFDLLHSYSFLTVLALLIVMRKKLKGIAKKDWLKIFLLGFIPLYTYLIAELKNNFLGISTLFNVVTSVTVSKTPGVTTLSIFLNNLAGLITNNLIPVGTTVGVLSVFVLLIIFLIASRKENPLNIFIIVWIGSIFALLLARGFMPFYSYAGIGIGVIVGSSLLLYKVGKFSKILLAVILLFIMLSNLERIELQSKKGLVVEIKAQPDMRLVDEILIVNKTYEYSKGQGFTIRTTTMPYLIQTVWSYLYNQYGYKKYGYLPYNENGNILGYPGYLPEPIKGSSCSRILIREPIRGIPQHLISDDVKKEDLFSSITKEEKIGEFVIQYRYAKSPDCHKTKAMPEVTF